MTIHQFVYEVGNFVLIGAALSGVGSLIWGSSKLGAVLLVRGLGAWFHMAVNMRLIVAWHCAGRPVWTHIGNGRHEMRPSKLGNWEHWQVAEEDAAE
jgi:hypothetical protein